MNSQMNKGNAGCAGKLSFLRVVPRVVPVTLPLETDVIVNCDCPFLPHPATPFFKKTKYFLSEGITGIDYRG